MTDTKRLWGSTWPLWRVVVAAAAPWLLTVVGTTTPAVLMAFVVLLALQFGAGVLGLGAVARVERFPGLLLLVPGAGYLLHASLSAFGVKAGVPAEWTFWSVAVLGIAGVVLLAARVDSSAFGIPVRSAPLYVLLSVCVCGVFFVPPAIRDAVVGPQGGFQWIYVDTQYGTAVSRAVKNAVGGPHMPGLYGAELDYHFGAYSIAGSIPEALGVTIPDAFARLLRPNAQIALLTSSMGLGVILARRAGLSAVTGLGSAVLLFFYGSLSALFSPPNNSSTELDEALLVTVPELAVSADGGPFAHLLLTHSTVHGSIAIAVVLAVVLMLLDRRRGWLRRQENVSLLPGMLAPVNSVAAAASGGLVAAALGRRSPREPMAWGAGVLALVGLAAAFTFMGFLDAGIGQMQWDVQFYRDVDSVTVWFLVGLGARCVLFSDVRHRYPRDIRLLVGLVIIGFLSLFLFFHDPYWGNDRYGLYFLQASLSMLAGPLLLSLATDWNRRTPRWETLVTPVLQGSVRAAAPLALISSIGYAATRISGAGGHLHLPYHFKVAAVVACSVFIAGGLTLLLLRGRRRILRTTAGAAVCVVFGLGFLAWIPSFANFGLDRTDYSVRVSPEEVDALEAIAVNSPEGVLVATNRHGFQSIPVRPNRSYAYFALSGRPVLLEGWEYGEKYHPRFTEVQQDNERIFSTQDDEILRGLVDKYGIVYLIARPGTDLSLPAPRPNWLQQIPAPRMNVYRVDEAGSG